MKKYAAFYLDGVKNDLLSAKQCALSTSREVFMAKGKRTLDKTG
ncbi:MAG: hypothetical protein U2P89_05050 [Proteiniphilum sp.]|nr:hypothetical protein [Proteiniphilum sp.]MDY9918225.1 hypothetical protein [Proteiniphilum sp.]